MTQTTCFRTKRCDAFWGLGLTSFGNIVGRSTFTSACLLYTLSLKLYLFHIFLPFPTLNYFPFTIKYFPTHLRTISIIYNIFPINPITSNHFPFKYFHFTSISIKLYIFHSPNQCTVQLTLIGSPLRTTRFPMSPR